MRHGADFVAEGLRTGLVVGTNKLTGMDLADQRRQVEARDREVANPFTKNMQLTAVHGARRCCGDKLIRVAKPHRFLDPAFGRSSRPRLHTLTLQEPRRTADQPGRAGPRNQRRAYSRPVRGGPGSWIRRWRNAWIPVTGGHVPRRLPGLPPHRQPRCRLTAGLGAA